MQGKALPGFRDFYPDALALRNHIFATWRSVARRYGFEEYDGPPLEPLDLYTQKSGEEIVQQLYAFRDKGDRDVALRPEMTPSLARMVGAREREQPAAVESRLVQAGVATAQAKAVLETASLRGLDAVVAALAKVQGGADAAEPLREVCGALDAMGLGAFAQVDLTIVRGLAYY